jgi:hypothetical protein
MKNTRTMTPRRNRRTKALVVVFLIGVSFTGIVLCGVAVSRFIQTDRGAGYLKAAGYAGGQPDWDWIIERKRAMYRERVKPNVEAHLPPTVKLPDLPDLPHPPK